MDAKDFIPKSRQNTHTYTQAQCEQQTKIHELTTEPPSQNGQQPQLNGDKKIKLTNCDGTQQAVRPKGYQCVLSRPQQSIKALDQGQTIIYDNTYLPTGNL